MLMKSEVNIYYIAKAAMSYLSDYQSVLNNKLFLKNKCETKLTKPPICYISP